MHLVTNLRKLNYSDLNRVFVFFMLQDVQTTLLSFYFVIFSILTPSLLTYHFMVDIWLLKLVDEWYCTSRHHVYILERRVGEKWDTKPAPIYPSLSLKQNFSELSHPRLGQVAPLASREAWEFGKSSVITKLDQS